MLILIYVVAMLYGIRIPLRVKTKVALRTACWVIELIKTLLPIRVSRKVP